MTRQRRIDYHVTNALGTTLFTSPDGELAKAWVKRNLRLHPSARVERVTVTIERELFYRPRVTLAMKRELAA